MSKTDIDPQLTHQLDAAEAHDLVEAVLLLRQGEAGAGEPIDVAALIGRAGGPADAELSYLPRLGALIARAEPQVIRDLIGQPEIQVASANRV